MKNKIRVHDPDLGVIYLPKTKDMSPAAAETLRRRIRKRLLDQRVYRAGSSYVCGNCLRQEVEAADDLSVELIRGEAIVVVMNLHGGRCRHCGAEHLEPRDMVRLDDLIDDLSTPEEEASISRIGRGTLGTYWPKAVERGLELEPGDQLKVKMLTRSSALVRIERNAAGKPRKQVRAKSPKPLKSTQPRQDRKPAASGATHPRRGAPRTGRV